MRPEIDARRARFVERGGVIPAAGDEAGALLDAILGSGEFLSELLFADAAALAALAADPWLRQSKPPALIAGAVESGTTAAADFTDFKRRLRLVRRREVLRMGARELGWGTTAEVARELSAFADACLQAATRFCDGDLRREYGAPETEAGEPPAQFVVMGMGKLGGEELNFSSDVDVCYFYSTDAGQAGEGTLHRYYAELSRRITLALEELTADGMIFRVDLRLRPESRNGPLCNSLAAAERYYETFGRTWERQAWLRARPCAGDLALGRQLLAILEPFVYPRHTEPRMLDEVRSLRAQFRDPADAGGALGDTGFDVKLGAGGIRDVELVVQTLQLLNGGKRPDIRERNTPRALPRLVVAGLLTDREAHTLADAYRFWRQLEHRVQVATGAQRHRLPAVDDERAWMATGLGFADLAAFDATVMAQRRAVEAIAATFADEALGPLEEAARLLNPLLERGDLERLLATAGFGDPESAADAMELARGRMPAAFVEQATASPDPDRALAHFRDLALRGSVGLMSLLRDHPRLLRMLGALFGTSDRLSDLLIRHPEMWEPFVEGLGARVRMADELRGRLVASMAAEAAASRAAETGGETEERSLRVLRRFQAEEILRIGLHDVAGSLDAGEVSGQLSALAEVCLGAAIELVMPGLVARLGEPRTGLTVLGLGSLGASEMRYGSDLDLVFLYGADGESTTGVGHQEWFGRASQRVIGALEVMLEEGRLYHVDVGLRPSGAQGLLVTSYGAFARYHQGEAAGWERVALLRARVVYSTEPAQERAVLEAKLAALAFDRPFDEAQFRAELRQMRDRVERERGRVPEGSRHLRFDRGGIMDVEFLVALGQLRHATDPAVRTPRTAAVIERLVALGWPATLGDDYAFLRGMALRLRLLHDRPEDVVSPRDLAPLARTLGLTPVALGDGLDRAMKRVRVAFTDVFGA
jgi:[glutamine synthetase] adenylyltransferase / [glutamine synthetase]-adenylyl-L-tyrosine phosphorylase